MSLYFSIKTITNAIKMLTVSNYFVNIVINALKAFNQNLLPINFFYFLQINYRSTTLTNHKCYLKSNAWKYEKLVEYFISYLIRYWERPRSCWAYKIFETNPPSPRLKLISLQKSGSPSCSRNSKFQKNSTDFDQNDLCSASLIKVRKIKQLLIVFISDQFWETFG